MSETNDNAGAPLPGLGWAPTIIFLTLLGVIIGFILTRRATNDKAFTAGAMAAHIAIRLELAQGRPPTNMEWTVICARELRK